MRDRVKEGAAEISLNKKHWVILMKLLDRALANYKGGTRVKVKKTKAIARLSKGRRRFESNRSISLCGYPHGDTGNSSSGEVSVYEWSVGDIGSATMSSNDDASESGHDEPVQNSTSETVRQYDHDPLDELIRNQLIPQCPRDAPVKSPLQSSTMRLNINKNNKHLDSPIPNHRRRDEERSGPVDVDDYLETSDVEQTDNKPHLTAPSPWRADTDPEVHNRKIDLAGFGISLEKLELRETDLQKEVELSYSLSSGFSSYCGSEGDSLRNIGDEDMECTPTHFRGHSVDSLEKRLQRITTDDAGLASRGFQGKIQGGDGRVVSPKNMLSPRRQLELANLQTDTQNGRKPMRNSKEKVGCGNIKPEYSQNKTRLSPQPKRKRKKSLTRHVISTFQTLLRSNNQDIDDKRKECSKVKTGLQKADLKKQLSCISMIPMIGDDDTILQQKSSPIYNPPSIHQRELKKGISCFSTTPMAGDMVIDFPNKPKLQNAKETLLERERLRVLDFNLQRQREKKKELEHQWQLCEKELKRQQKISSIAIRGVEVDKTLTPTMIAKVEANRNRQKIQNWVMGCSNLTMEEHPGGASIISSALPWLCDTNRTIPGEASINDASTALPRSYDPNGTKPGGSSINDASTAIVDNTLPNPNNLVRCREESKKAEANCADELSSVSTPEAVMPSSLKTLCVVCNKRERTHLALPCMHFSYCEDCVAILEKKHVEYCIVCNEKNITFSKVLFD